MSPSVNSSSSDVVIFGSDTDVGTSWYGNLIGVADGQNYFTDMPTVLQIETGGPDSVWFVGFNNRKVTVTVRCMPMLR